MDPRHWHTTRFMQPTITLLHMWNHAPLEFFTLLPIDRKPYPPADRRVPEEKRAAFWQSVDALLANAGLL